MFSSMPTSFSPRKTAANPNLENQPPYAAVSNNETTTYGGIFNHWNSFASEGHEKSPVFGPGIYASICGSRLLAPTWANKPKQHGVFFTCSGIKKTPPLMEIYVIIPWEGGKRRVINLGFTKNVVLLAYSGGYFWRFGWSRMVISLSGER